MKKIRINFVRFGFLIIVLASSIIISAQSQSNIPRPRMRSIILFSWDGVNRDVFMELLDSGNLTFIQSLGHVLNHSANTEFKARTATRPQHAIMLSGYLANVTGIIGNGGNKSGPARLPEGYSVFERVRAWFEHSQTTILLKPRIVAGIARMTILGHILGFNATGRYYNINSFDVFECGQNRISAYPPLLPFPGDNAVKEYLEIADDVPFFLYFFYFPDPDMVGAKYGLNSIEYRKAIVNCDNATRQICQKLQNRNPVIIVTSDHGFGYPELTNHGHAPNTFLATNLPVVHADSNMADIVPTIYDCLGIPYEVFTPKLNGISLLR